MECKSGKPRLRITGISLRLPSQQASNWAKGFKTALNQCAETCLPDSTRNAKNLFKQEVFSLCCSRYSFWQYAKEDAWFEKRQEAPKRQRAAKRQRAKRHQSIKSAKRQSAKAPKRQSVKEPQSAKGPRGTKASRPPSAKAPKRQAPKRQSAKASKRSGFEALRL